MAINYKRHFGTVVVQLIAKFRIVGLNPTLAKVSFPLNNVIV